MFLIDTAHERSSGRQDLIDENEDRLLRAELDALTNDVDELAHGEVGGDEVFLFVDRGNVALFYLFADDLVGSLSVVFSEGLCGLLYQLCFRRGCVGCCEVVVVLTGMRSAYFWRMRSASAFLFSKGLGGLACAGFGKVVRHSLFVPREVLARWL